jgi:drug/metabolite transporter (DMT)-like permease
MTTLFGIKTDTFRGIAWMMGVIASFLSMAVAGRMVLADMGIFQVLFLRSVICLFILAALLPRFGVASLATRQPLFHLGRNIFQFAGQWGWFFGVAWIPMTSVFSIEFTIPIWTAVLSAIFLGEALTRARITAILMGFAGVLIILRPGMETVHPASLAVLFASFCFASTYVFTRYLTRSETTYTILVYMILVQLPLSGALAYSEWVPLDFSQWPWILIIAVTGLTSQLCLTRAFRLAEATIVVPFDFLRLPLGAVVGYLLFNDPLEALVFVGAIIIFSGNFINVWAERGRK